MEEIKTKRGKIGFGEEKILLEENYLDYFRNLYRELWVEGEHHHMLTMFLLVFAMSYSAVMFIAMAVFIGLQNLFVFGASTIGVFGLIWLIQRKRGFTTDKKIFYEDIKDVELVKGRNWLTCPRFIIKYQVEDSTKKRYVAMHSHMIPGVDDRIRRIKENFESNEIEIV